MKGDCQAVRRALEEGAGAGKPALESHLLGCPPCRAQASLLELLAELEPSPARAEDVVRLMERLPTPTWQLRRVATWGPFAAGGLLVAAGIGLVGGLPGGSAVTLLPSVSDRILAWVVSGGLDVLAALRGSADALRILLVTGGAGASVWLLLTAVGGGLAVRALVKRSVGTGR